MVIRREIFLLIFGVNGYNGSGLIFNFKNMATLTIDDNINLSKTHFTDIEELYLAIQEQLKFELNLQKKAQRAMDIDELELIDL
jgi:hypothetical protein